VLAAVVRLGALLNERSNVMLMDIFIINAISLSPDEGHDDCAY